jgi:hypothetical protein
MKLCLLACASLCAAQSVAINTERSSDGKGGVQRNVVVIVDGSKIVRIEPAGPARPTYDLRSFTLVPGWMDVLQLPQAYADNVKES